MPVANFVSYKLEPLVMMIDLRCVLRPTLYTYQNIEFVFQQRNILAKSVLLHISRRVYFSDKELLSIILKVFHWALLFTVYNPNCF